MGRPHRPAGPDAEPLRTRTRLGKPPREKDPSAPGTTTSRAPPAIEVQPRHSPHPRIQSPSTAASLPSRRLDQAPTPRTRAPLLVSHHLLWGFSQFPCSTTERGEGGERGRRRGAPPPAPRRGDRSAVRDQGTGAEEGRHRDDDVRREEQSRHAAAVHHYTAPPVFPEPATTTPPTQCECRRSCLYLFSTLVSSRMLQRRRDTPPYEPALVLAIEPQDFRPATEWCSWATHALEPAVAVRGSCV
jgi:hypothetical protein